jgi:hypothetical protein
MTRTLSAIICLTLCVTAYKADAGQFTPLPMTDTSCTEQYERCMRFCDQNHPLCVDDCTNRKALCLMTGAYYWNSSPSVYNI